VLHLKHKRNTQKMNAQSGRKMVTNAQLEKIKKFCSSQLTNNERDLKCQQSN
jgi:hypothetical protein